MNVVRRPGEAVELAGEDLTTWHRCSHPRAVRRRSALTCAAHRSQRGRSGVPHGESRPRCSPVDIVPASLGLNDSLTLARGENSVIGHDSILPFPRGAALTVRLNDLSALLLRTPVAAATVRDETTLEVIGSRAVLAEQTARCLDDSAHRAPRLLGDAVERFESIVCE